jgi:hypothetical protein
MGDYSMKKKTIGLLLIIMLVLPASVFAGGFLGFKVGAAGILNYPINLETFEPEELKDVTLEDLSFGLDARLNVSVLEVSALLQGQAGDESAEVFGHIGLGLSLELLNLIDLGITAGPKFSAVIDEEGVTPDIDPENLDDVPLYIRATADVNLGGISVGGFLMVDPKVTIGQLKNSELPDPETVSPMAEIGLSVMLSLF